MSLVPIHSVAVYPSLYARTALRLDLVERYGRTVTTAGPVLVANILSKIRAYRRYRQTIRELIQFSDRELEDLGISRYEFDAIARQNAVRKENNQ